MGLLPMKETIMEFKCWLWLVLSGGNPPLTPDLFFQFNLWDEICPCVSPKKGIQKVLEGPKISRYLRHWYLRAIRVLQVLEISIYVRGFHIFLHSGMCKIMLKYIWVALGQVMDTQVRSVIFFFLGIFAKLQPEKSDLKPTQRIFSWN
jgi:hypothetical protein